jgi:hypothetical protein
MKTKKKRKLRQIPAQIFGLSEATLFGKTYDECHFGFLADAIKAGRRENNPLLLPYDRAQQRGELSMLQKILEQGDAHETTRFKLLQAYKAALADSDCFIGSLVDAIDLSKPPRRFSYRNFSDLRIFLGWSFWGLIGAKLLASIIREHGLNPPILARVRVYFRRLYPECRRNWPEGDVSRDKVHRTTIVRLGLPLAKGRVGRPPKVKTSS